MSKNRNTRRLEHLKEPAPSSLIGGGGHAMDIMGSAFTGAQQSIDRSFVFFPQLDSRLEIDTISRTEVMRRARWLYNNDGFTRGVISSYTRMAGTLIPRPKTPDKEWNKLAKRLFNDLTSSGKRFDRSGKYSFPAMQRALTRSALKDGDCLTVPTTTASGTTQYIIYEGHQIGSAPRHQRKQAEEARKKWLDGVMVDEFNRHHAYRILGGKDKNKTRTLPASSAHLFTRFERPGQPRGISACAHLVDHAVDVRDISRDMSKGMKVRNLIGFYMAAKDPEMPFGLTSKGLQNSLSQWRNRASTGDDVDADPNQVDKEFSYEEVVNSANMFRAENYEPKVLESSQPHENEMAFLDFRCRQMSLGLDLPPEVTWKMSNLNGNTMRWVAEGCEEVFENYRREVLEPFCRSVWFHVIGAEIASGRLREPNVKDDQKGIVGWWTVDFISPRRKTLDRGREGKLRLEEHRSLLTNLDALYSELQLDWTEELSQYFDEIDWIIEDMKSRKWSDPMVEAILSKFLAPAPGTAPTNLHGEDTSSSETIENDSEKP